LRLEAKRRVAAGEFPALHEAQVAIAREHGLPSWAVLKQACAQPQQESRALAQLRWVISRFSGADRPGWTAPADDELSEHFDDRFLAAIPARYLVAQLSQAVVNADPPYRLTGLRGLPLAERITDPRVSAPPPASTQAPTTPTTPETPQLAEIAAIADDAFAELGLAALILAGGEPGRPAWVVAKGHADLDRAEVLDASCRFPAPGVTALVTATAVLRLVAEGRLGLDAAANDHLRTVRLADDAVTVRELLSHCGGVGNPAELYADRVPDLATLMGPVVPCGIVRPSNGGYAVLGQLIADATGMPYARAVTRLVLDPLGMHDSRFPAGPADIGTDMGAGAVTAYTVTPAGAFPGPGPGPPGRRRALVHRGRPRAPGHRLVIPAARGPGRPGSHRPGRSRLVPGRTRLAHQPGR
jgi:CubicO group peptidase (beta-lactamase class C family)